MKVYYQGLDKCKCYVDDFKCIEEILEIEIDEHFGNEKTQEEKDVIFKEQLNKIANLKAGENIEFIGFRWGLEEMSEEEFKKLGEFDGW